MGLIFCQAAPAKQLVGRTACEGHDLIPDSFHFFSILASSLILSLFFEVIQKQINVCLHFAVIYNLYSDFIVLVFFLHVIDSLYF